MLLQALKTAIVEHALIHCLSVASVARGTTEQDMRDVSAAIYGGQTLIIANNHVHIYNKMLQQSKWDKIHFLTHTACYTACESE